MNKLHIHVHVHVKEMKKFNLTRVLPRVVVRVHMYIHVHTKSYAHESIIHD